ncbi:SAM-dependent methyltransferase [Erysipelothrix sp. HDW6C]|uniref:class I SAM-dependent methyltransferase n=1 Tax=Erysipelothrix sp. HDW6C TaxID=2714930 RepID=UPI00140B5E56|nr:class I SAM-dependent methyltransferase [Erysipelothrix sp. HDW6C]QIK69674.1 SAM-dependent methyltransferase [Erysipelothrix sp. HDW6C]
MRFTNDWRDFEVIDAGNGTKIERYNDITLKRPEPVATWAPMAPQMHVDAAFNETWRFYKKLPTDWTIRYKDLSFLVRPTTFKHTGIFPEQAVNWDWMRTVIQTSEKPLRILNLFGYTGGATIACAMEDNVEEVVHIDALKSLNEWAQENVALNDLGDKKIRTITEDVMKFLEREKRRGRTYHGIIMDPPSYGRGPKGERWKIENQLQPLMEAALAILDPEALFMVINTYTTNLEPKRVHFTLQNALNNTGFPAHIHSEEIGLPITTMQQKLNCGVTTRWCYREDLF